MKTRLAFAVLLSAAFAVGPCIGAGQQAASATSAAAPAVTANRFAATIAPSERFEVRGLLVERHGSGGRPLILIPGLVSGSWVWQDTIRAFAGEHTVYVLTLPGFDGRPPAGASPIANARAAVEELIASRHLDKPVIVGHSLGGTLALAVAEDRPAALGGVVSIDGLPVMPGTEDMPAGARAGAAQRIQASITGQKGEAFATQQQNYMRTIGVLDMGKADDLARLSARSDPASAGLWAADDVALDLRPGLAGIAAPVLVLVPYFDLDATAQAGQQPITESVKLDYYRSLMQGTPKLQVAAVSPARHFAMIDAPDKVIEAIRTFLKAL
jgi:pimeloyl-ACP methyl ester carboxylesterase